MKKAILINEFGKRTCISPAMAIVITADSNINPMKELGNPKTVDCHESATFPHETTALMLHERSTFSSLANLNASMERTIAAKRLSDAEINIVKYALRTRRAVTTNCSDMAVIVTYRPSLTPLANSLARCETASNPVCSSLALRRSFINAEPTITPSAYSAKDRA